MGGTKMSVKQISVFVENQAGLLSEVTTLLADNGINLRALSIADTSDFGILRIIVEDVEKAARILRLAHESAGTLDTGTVRVSFGWDASPYHTGNLVAALEKYLRIREKHR